MRQLTAAKIATLLFLSVILVLFPAVSQANWSDLVEVGPGGETADLAVDRNSGNVHVVHFKDGLIWTKLDPDGEILAQEAVPGATLDAGGYRFSGTVAVDMQGNPHLTYRIHLGNNFYDGYYLYRTTTGWSNPVKIFSNIERGNQIRMAIDANNRVHIIHPEHITDGFCKVSYLQIYNGSISISHSKMTGTYENKANDHIEIDVSQDGSVYMVLGCPDAGRAQRIFISNNAGGSFDPGLDIRGTDVIHNQSVCGSPDVFVDEGGISHVVYGSTRDASRNYQPSVRYARFQNGEMRLNIPISSLNEMGTWDPGQGIGSVAASDEGQYVMVVYSKKDAGELRYRFSDDFGANFTSPTQLETSAGGYSGRDKAKVRAYKKRFYLAYTKNNSVYVRFYSVPGFNPPTANAGGPYTGIEGTPITFSAALSSDDIGLDKYEWDWDNDGVYDDQTTTTTIQHSFPDEYSGTIKLRVTDDTNLTSVAEATVTITNAAPIPAIASSFSGQEGSPVTLSVTPNDPGTDDTHTYSWDFGDGQTSTEASPAHSFPDNGSYLVQVTVYDDDGGEGQAQTTAIISNVNPTASAGGPYNTRMGTPTPLNATATDPAGDNDPLTFAWDIDNDGVYDLSGQTVQAVFTSEGTKTVKLQVADDDGGTAIATATVSVGKAAPIISEIGAQIVNEGTAFRTIDLDDYCEDMDTPDNQLEWTQSGAESLLVYLDFTTHELSVEVPHEEWSGTENIRLEVTDPNNNTAQEIVEYTVQAVNDNPELKNIPAQFIAEDDTLIMRWSSLILFASDPDNNQADFSFSIINNLNTRAHWDDAMKALLIYGKPNWSGEETITMKVTDGSGGVGTKDFQIWVTPVPDAPDDFSLTSPLNEAFSMWPETIQFRWNASNDPDEGEGVVYRWVLSRYDNFQSILERSPDMTMNSYAFTNTKGRDPGLYYWRVEAEGDDGLITYSTNYGILNLNSKQPVISYVPDQIINEGEDFEDIHLDAIVTDADNSKDELYWQVQGEDELIVIISSARVASIRTPHDKWHGEETLRFIVTDPTALSDTTDILFRVLNINSAPELSPVPAQRFDEDTSLELSRTTLEDFVEDEDNEKSEMTFRLINNPNIRFAATATNGMRLFTEPNWCGQEVVTMVVNDGAGGADSTNFLITVTAMPDAPSSFSLLSPKDMQLFQFLYPQRFLWEQVVDPDPDDRLSYWFLMSNNAAFTDTIANKVLPYHDANYFDYYSDRDIPKGTYFWKMYVMDMWGNTVECDGPAIFTTLLDFTTSVEDLPEARPVTFELYQNHPNPFNPETLIRYDLPENSQVRLTVFNTMGQEVRHLVNQQQSAGSHEIRWDARDDYGNAVTSGVYIYQIRMGDVVQYKKMLLLQ